MFSFSKFSAGSASSTEPSKSTRIRFSLVAEAGEDGEIDLLNDPNHPGKQVRVFKDAILDEQAVRNVNKATDSDASEDHAIELELTDVGGETFHAFTEAHVRRSLAIVVDGNVISCCKIMAAIRTKMRISLQSGSTDAAADAIVDSIQSALKGATTKPTHDIK